MDAELVVKMRLQQLQQTLKEDINGRKLNRNNNNQPSASQIHLNTMATERFKSEKTNHQSKKQNQNITVQVKSLQNKDKVGAQNDTFCKLHYMSRNSMKMQARNSMVKKKKKKIIQMVNSDFTEDKDMIKKAVLISKRASRSLPQIEDQINKQKKLDKTFKDAGVVGKQSLLKNLVLRNNLHPEQKKLSNISSNNSKVSSFSNHSFGKRNKTESPFKKLTGRCTSSGSEQNSAQLNNTPQFEQQSSSEDETYRPSRFSQYLEDQNQPTFRSHPSTDGAKETVQSHVLNDTQTWNGQDEQSILSTPMNQVWTIKADDYATARFSSTNHLECHDDQNKKNKKSRNSFPQAKIQKYSNLLEFIDWKHAAGKENKAQKEAKQKHSCEEIQQAKHSSNGHEFEKHEAKNREQRLIREFYEKFHIKTEV